MRWAIRLASWGVLVAAVLLLVTTYVHSRRTKVELIPVQSLPYYGELPAFSLTAHTRNAITLEDLRGKVWVANFFFTTCRSICPIMQENVATEVYAALKDNPQVRLVSFTVDPEHDTPEVLAEYARAKGVSPEKWTFVTGAKKDIYRLARKGFKLAAEDTPEYIQGTKHDFIHSEKLVLVDAHGRIRGYYNGLDLEQVRQLVRDVDRLLREEMGDRSD
ncbi:MAG: SCO family protein [Armatimonadota bacterium]|nr:SCO family protein [bacterium]MDW8319829.1 SCO family protein [Armatimonadota bacterium]